MIDTAGPGTVDPGPSSRGRLPLLEELEREVPAVVFMGIWFLIQFASGALSLAEHQAAEGVAWWAHVGGFVAGLALCPLFLLKRKKPRRMYLDEYGLEGGWLRS